MSCCTTCPHKIDGKLQPKLENNRQLSGGKVARFACRGGEEVRCDCGGQGQTRTAANSQGDHREGTTRGQVQRGKGRTIF